MTGGLLLYVWVNNIEIIWNNERIINVTGTLAHEVNQSSVIHEGHQRRRSIIASRREFDLHADRAC